MLSAARHGKCLARSSSQRSFSFSCSYSYSSSSSFSAAHFEFESQVTPPAHLLAHIAAVIVAAAAVAPVKHRQFLEPRNPTSHN